ncbi:MAG: VWA domain-containing protein [Deltaproteobacteria bacterium]|nr:VWA domain-containing protein [Deltaproteobacteria bacterium]
MITFHSPWFFLLLLLIPWLIKAANNTAQHCLFHSSRVAVATLSPSWRVRYRQPILNSLQVLIFVLLIIALARPQTSQEYREVEASGRDIMLALDISGSMEAMDFFINDKRVNRLTALKYVVHQFIAGRVGDRLGLIVFSENVFTQCPLTLDHGVVAQYLNNLEVGMAGQSTAIGDGLAIAIKRLQAIPAKSKVIVLVSDGKSNAGTVMPVEAARIAADQDIKIHTIGIGDNGLAPFPDTSIFGTARLVPKQLEFDEQTLRAIAQKTGGQYFHAKSTEALIEIYKAIDKLEERKELVEQYTDYHEQFMPLLLLAVFLLIIEEILRTTYLRVIP